MRVINKIPPNYEQIAVHFKLDDFQPIFAYGDTIYNPHNIEITEDLQIHEQVHMRQQEMFPSPDAWWSLYLTDSNFRKSQEVEAYAAQYRFVQTILPAKYSHEVLDAIGDVLSSEMYRLGISKHQAMTAVRIKSKQ